MITKLLRRVVDRLVDVDLVDGRWVAEDTKGIMGRCVRCDAPATVILSHGKLGTVGQMDNLCRKCAEHLGFLPPCKSIMSGSYIGQLPVDLRTT